MREASWSGKWDTTWEDLADGTLSVAGSCSFNPEHGATLTLPSGDLSLAKELRRTGAHVSAIEGGHFDYLYGIAEDGTRVVLRDAISVHRKHSIAASGFASTETFVADAVLVSEEPFNPAAGVTSLKFDLGGLASWLGVDSNPAWWKALMDFDPTRRRRITLDASSERNAEIILIDDSLPESVRTHPSGSCCIAIRYGTPKAFDNAWMDDFNELRSLFTLCFGVFPSLSWLLVKFEGCTSWVHVYRGSANASEETTLPSEPPIPLIALESLESPGIQVVVNRWFSLTTDEHYAAVMLASLLSSWNIPIDLLLFAATTMLESLGRSDMSDQYSEDELNREIETMVSIAGEKTRARARGILRLLKEPSYSQILDHVYEETMPWSVTLIPDWKKFKGRQISLRHAGAHGKDERPDPRVQIDHERAQIILAYIILMKRLGLPSGAIDRFIHSNFLNVARWRITNRYASN